MKIDVEKLVLGSVNTNCYIVGFNGNCLIIDPSSEAEKILRVIEEKKVKPLAILLTHGHFDHVMATKEIAEKYHLEIYASEKETDLLQDASKNLAMQFLGEDFTLKATRLLKNGDEPEFKGLRLKVIETPGHTRGSISFLIENLENEDFQRVIFSGDSIFNGSIGRVDFPTGSEKMMRNTIHEIYKKLPEDTVIFSGHGSVTTVGNEKKKNPYFL